MTPNFALIWGVGILTLGISVQAPAEEKLPDLPEKEGVAGAFAGVIDGTLIVAGGANFPDRKPWEGGTKVWHDAIYVLENKTSPWKLAGRLPHALAYGVSVTHGDDVVMVGGADATKHYADAFVLSWKDGQLAIKSLPPLPQSLAYGCGIMVGTKLYLSGGQSSPDTPPVKSLYRLDLAQTNPRWETLLECPGSGRMLAAIARHGDSLWIMGGVELVKNEQGQLQRKYLDTVYRYDEKSGWKEMARLPKPSTAAPSPGPQTKDGFLLLGGDDGAQVAQEPLQHRGFSPEIWEYDVAKDNWREMGKLPSPRVTTPCVWWNGKYLIPSGEIKPGRRTSTMLMLDLPESRAEQ